jgi:non-ribosomal peptide synthetase component F/acyl carrier protein
VTARLPFHPSLSAAQRDLLQELNGEPAPPWSGPLDRAFWEQRAVNPEAIAVLGSFGQLSYAELGHRAEAIAAWLLAQGTGGRLVAVSMRRGWEPVAALLGTLRAGAAFAAVEMGQRGEEREEWLREIEPAAVLTNVGRIAGPDLDVPCLQIDESLERQRRLPAVEVTANALAYVAQVADARGGSRGVAMSHAAASATLTASCERVGLIAEDRMLSMSRVGSDQLIWDVLAPLSAGAALIVSSATDPEEPESWLQLSSACHATVWSGSPLLGSELQSASLEDASWPRLVILTRESSTLDAVRSLAPRPGKCRIVSLGGAVEASSCSTFRFIEEPQPAWPSVPWGRPLRGQKAYVLDDKMRLRRTWAEGRLYLAGAGLAVGYWKAPSLTAERFATHPDTGERLFDTGKRARYRADGEIDILEERPVAPKVRSASLTAPTDVDPEYAARVAAIEGKVCQYLRDVVDVERIAATDRLLALGADSVRLLQLAGELEREFGIVPQLELVFSDPTIGDFARALAAQPASGETAAQGKTFTQWLSREDKPLTKSEAAHRAQQRRAFQQQQGRSSSRGDSPLDPPEGTTASAHPAAASSVADETS